MIEEFWSFVNERHAIYIRKSLREGIDPSELYHAPDRLLDQEEVDPEMFAVRDSGPLTLDPILNQYRFCNVFRELDRVTQWIDMNIRRPYKDHQNLWFMLAIARTINWPATLKALMDYNESWPAGDEFSPEGLGAALDWYSAEGNKVYTGAYMIRAESNAKAEWYSWTKQQYIAQIVLGRLWADREKWQALLEDQPEEGLTLQAVWELFQNAHYIGWGPFMAYQVVVDMRHTRYLRNAPDINGWAAVGPGSRRGLNRLIGQDPASSLSQDRGLGFMIALWLGQDEHRAPWVPPIELSDIQNCLCEFDKHQRVKRGEGRPRATYVPGRGW